jgi:hypothetical protein
VKGAVTMVIVASVRKANVAEPDEGENEPLKLRKTAAETPFSFLTCTVFKDESRRICGIMKLYVLQGAVML